MITSNTYHFATADIKGSSVDRENGIVRGVSVITAGLEAKGHRLKVDMKTLRQMHELAVKKEQVPVKWNHGSGADAVNGFLTNFRIEGKKLKADWHLLRTHGQYEQAIELAERMPQNVGFSTSFAGLPETASGQKVYPPDEKTKVHYTLLNNAPVPLGRKEEMFARCDDLVSVDLVATPAANPGGMFSVPHVDSAPNGMAENALPGSPDEKDPNAVLLAEFRQFATGMNERITRLEERFEEDPDDDADDDDDEDDGDDAEGGEEPTGFGSFEQALHYFEARLDRIADERERQEFAAAQEELEHNFAALVEVNETLRGENEVLARALQEFSAKTKQTVEFSAGTDGQTRVQLRDASGAPLTEFEKRVSALKETGLSAADAMVKAVDEDLPRYQQHLQAKKAITTTL